MQYRIAVHAEGYVRLALGAQYRGVDLPHATRALALMCREHGYPRALVVAVSELDGGGAGGLAEAIRELPISPPFRLGLVSPVPSTHRAFARTSRDAARSGVDVAVFHQEAEAVAWLIGNGVGTFPEAGKPSFHDLA